MPGFLITIFANLFAPLIIVIWVAVARAMSRVEAVLMVLIGIAAVTFEWFAAPIWVTIGMFWRPVMAALLVGAIARLAARTAPAPAWPRRGWRDPRMIMPALVFVAFASQLEPVLAGRSTPAGAMELQWPLRDGRFVVFHGGNSSLINHHYGVQAQRYALDIVAVDTWGFRARGLAPDALNGYQIFDHALHAPCDGEVVGARDGIADAFGGTDDLAQAAGNYAAIFCQGNTVLLAHIKAGSLAVKAGDHVQTGQLIGHVGSSGNSSEPHLHIHADAGRVDDPLAIVSTARGVPMTFDGRFLVRNDLVLR